LYESWVIAPREGVENFLYDFSLKKKLAAASNKYEYDQILLSQLFFVVADATN